MKRPENNTDRAVNSKDFYHVCTDGLTKTIVFKDEEDFIYGMNCAAMCALIAGIEIFAFCLMSNHVHFIIRGEYTSVVDFIKNYRTNVSRMVSAKYKCTKLFSEAKISVTRIDTADYLLTAIGYVLRNPMAANIPVLPTGYRWSSARVYFTDMHPSGKDTQKISDLTYRKKRELFRTRWEFPEKFRVDENGMILLEDYVEYQKVEKLFNSPKQFQYYLSKNTDSEIEMDTGILQKTRYRDSELLVTIETISLQRFKSQYCKLPIKARLEVAKILRKEFLVSPKQLGRVTGLDPNLLEALF